MTDEIASGIVPVFARSIRKATNVRHPTLHADDRPIDAADVDRAVRVTLSDNSSRIATAAEDGDVIVWDAPSGKPLRRWHTGSGSIRSIDFSQDGRSLLTAAAGLPPRLWDIDYGRLMLEPAAAFAAPTSSSWAPARFTPDGGQMVIGTGWGVFILGGRPIEN